MSSPEEIEKKALLLSKRERWRLARKLISADHPSKLPTTDSLPGNSEDLIKALKALRVPKSAKGDSRLEYLLKKHVSKK